MQESSHKKLLHNSWNTPLQCCGLQKYRYILQMFLDSTTEQRTVISCKLTRTGSRGEGLYSPPPNFTVRQSRCGLYFSKYSETIRCDICQHSSTILWCFDDGPSSEIAFARCFKDNFTWRYHVLCSRTKYFITIWVWVFWRPLTFKCHCWAGSKLRTKWCFPSFMLEGSTLLCSGLPSDGETVFPMKL